KRGSYCNARKGAYSVRSMFAGCGSWSARQLRRPRDWFWRRRDQTANASSFSCAVRARSTAGFACSYGNVPRGACSPTWRAPFGEHGVGDRGRERDVAVAGEPRQGGDVGGEHLRLGPEQADGVGRQGHADGEVLVQLGRRRTQRLVARPEPGARDLRLV